MWPIAITISALLLCQQWSSAWSTRLPLEVYELTPPTAAAAATENASPTNSSSTSYLQHKNLEYATVNAKTMAAPANHSETPADLHYLETQARTQKSEHRRSRQMLEIIERQHQQQHQQQQQQHRYNHDAMLQQKQQKQQQTLLQQKDATGRQRHAHAYDVRILYQIGDSEDDLPICAPNAVCSKIDLYETPWIERQCRCPELNRQPHVVVHHHHHNNNNNKDSLASSLHSAEKFRSYYEQEKLLQHKRLLVGEFSDKKFESLHLKKLMQKLGAVYEEDLQLSPSDYAPHEDNDALPTALEQTPLDALSDNEFPHVQQRSYYNTAAGSAASSGAHMRHSAHSTHNHRVKEPASFIGGCPSGLGVEDGHTIADKTRHYKLCQPVHKLPVCKHFRDYTWTLTTSAVLNITEQIVHCRCPKNSVTYLTKREPAADGANGYRYLFACSPLTRIRCQRKQPCKLFTVRKRQEFLDEVNINALCQCPKGHRCPSHHTQSGVIPGESFLEDNIQTYSGYCMAND